VSVSRSSTCPCGQRGVTLIELLVVLVLIGFMMAMGSVYLRANYVRLQLSNTALSLKQSLGSATWYTTTNRGPVYVWLDNVNTPAMAGRLTITGDAAATQVLYRTTIPNTLWVSSNNWLAVPAGSIPTSMTSTSPFWLQCDTMNRALHYSSTVSSFVPADATTPIFQFSITHLEMKNGKITPRIDYQLQISPLWAVQSTAVKS